MTSRAAAKSCVRHIINFNDALSRRAARRRPIRSSGAYPNLLARSPRERAAPGPEYLTIPPPAPLPRPPSANPHSIVRVIAPVLIAPLLAAWPPDA